MFKQYSEPIELFFYFRMEFQPYYPYVDFMDDKEGDKKQYNKRAYRCVEVCSVGFIVLTMVFLVLCVVLL